MISNLTKERRKAAVTRLAAKIIPRDPSSWTVEDWCDLYRGLQAIKRKIAKRHREEKIHPLVVGHDKLLKVGDRVGVRMDDGRIVPCDVSQEPWRFDDGVLEIGIKGFDTWCNLNRVVGVISRAKDKT